MNPNQFFVDQKLKRAIASLELATQRVASTETLLELTRLMGQAQADALVKSLSIVRQAAYRLKTVAERRAEELVAKLTQALLSDPEGSTRRLQEAYRACCGVFPKQATQLRNTLEKIRSSNGLSVTGSAATDSL
jgi:hypothetical protein